MTDLTATDVALLECRHWLRIGCDQSDALDLPCVFCAAPGARTVPMRRVLLYVSPAVTR